MRETYTPAQLEFLKAGYRKMRIPELTRVFNRRFRSRKTEKAIESAMMSRGFTSGRRRGFKKGERRLLTKEQHDYLRRAYKNLPSVNLTAALNERFGLHLTLKQVVGYVSKHHITSGRTGHFRKGNVPANKGTKGVMKANSGSFTNGGVPGNRRPVGSERICSKDGVILVKVAERNPWTGLGWYRRKHVVLWEQHHGPVPDGMCVAFRDGDNMNCVDDNLMLLTRQELLYLNKNRYRELPDELKPTLLAMAKLEAKRFALQKRAHSLTGMQVPEE